MAIIISSAEFNKVANFFGAENVRMAKSNTSIVIKPNNNVMNDNRENTVQYALYKYEDGWRWRRFIMIDWYNQNELRPYQLFRHGIDFVKTDWGKYPNDYVFESFNTIEDALARFMKYVNRFNMNVKNAA